MNDCVPALCRTGELLEEVVNGRDVDAGPVCFIPVTRCSNCEAERFCKCGSLGFDVLDWMFGAEFVRCPVSNRDKTPGLRAEESLAPAGDVLLVLGTREVDFFFS